MRTKEQRKKDYEDGYKRAIEEVKERIGYNESIGEILSSLWLNAAWICPGFFVKDKRRYVSIKTAWIKGYEKALLDIQDGKIKLEVEK